MYPALPPTPPAIVRPLFYVAAAAVSAMAAPVAATNAEVRRIVRSSRPGAQAEAAAWRVPFQIGPKTHGKRSASLRSRSNRRKK